MEEEPMALPEPLNMLSPEENDLLTTFLEPARFAENECIFRASDPGDGCYIIDEGTVRIELPQPELDSEGVLFYLEPGALLGELSLLDRLPRSASAWAETAVAARKLPAAGVDELLARHPRLGAAVMHALGRDAALKLRRSTAQLAEHLFEGRGATDPEVEEMVARARAAQAAIADWPEERIDGLLIALAEAVAARNEELATATVRETKLGNVADKVVKNYVASMGVLQSLVGRPASGELRTDAERGVTEIAAPAGVIFGLVPVTNPVATTIFKTLVALKGRNALILSPHRACLGVGNATGEIIREVLEAHGAPGDLVQTIRARGSRRKTARFMNHPGVSLVLATGGPGIVEVAYSSGTPAIGVGPGNAPTWVCADADLAAAAAAIVASKSFDNGLICGSEHNLVVDAAVRDAFVAALEGAGAAVLSAPEAARFTAAVVDPEGHGFRPQIIGQSAATIAGFLKIAREAPIQLIVVPADPDFTSPYTGEKMAPVLSLFTVAEEEEGLALCRKLLEHHGTGHTAIIHSADPARITRYGRAMPASRILVNSPGSQGVCGATTGLTPSFTLGCGTFGRNSTTDNVTYTNLLNIKRLAHYVAPAPAAGAGGAATGLD